MSGSVKRILPQVSRTGLLLLLVFVGINVCKAAEHTPLVALLAEKIQTQDSVVLVDRVIAFPNEESVYGPGQENYGMPVSEEYGSGVVVIVYAERAAALSDFPFFNMDMLEVKLFSDGQQLSSSGGGEIGLNRVIYSFSLWAEADGPPTHTVKLDELGELDLIVTVFKPAKVFDIPDYDIPPGARPVFEDENVQVQEIRWYESGSKKRATVKVGINNKTASARYILIHRKNGGSRAWSGVAHFKTAGERSIDISGETGMRLELWKVVPLVSRKISSLELIPWSAHPVSGNP